MPHSASSMSPQLVGFLGECSGRVEGDEECEQMSRRRQARQERGEWLREWEGEGQQSREELAGGEEREEEEMRESERQEEERQEEERQRQCTPGKSWWRRSGGRMGMRWAASLA